MTSQQSKAYFSARLVPWYRHVKRDLPWRRTRDPYHIWISEIMLQQTRVEAVIPYFLRFTERFPTIDALADAPEEDVLKLWEGLGYYSRARNLQAAAREVRDEHGGIVPSTKEAVSALKGVGPYTAGAILSIAYNVPEPAVDGNVMRVLSRYFALEDDIAKPATRVKIEKLAKELIPDGAAGDFNQGLMELGATVCTPRSPKCLVCPVMEHCAARIAGREEELPIKTKAKKPRLEPRAVALVEGEGAQAGKLLIRQRPQEGLLARMWELPHVPVERAPGAEPDAPAEMDALARELASGDGVAVWPSGWWLNTEHVFSHIRWELAVYRCRPDARLRPEALPPHYRWIGPEDVDAYAFPNVFVRLLQRYWGRGGAS
ncbi:adenine DNA glycosylase [Paenibacillus sp. J31TS4]|uniref:A/G-specific adenine glycosylase n=1 Tax=Paenibacillus sp. J31TS4 TaxID=2807195 RepID=UPI001B24B03F|nr:A/G-specific adenine glycosylase [Paenibacillus sp. J31TS4]GIP41070.1 adenine DNA glycosylase [Paenibacillus sp. J31TS4]